MVRAVKSSQLQLRRAVLTAAPGAMRFNVLHLIADDLRTSIGAYGHTDAAKTPHLDRLAAQGVVFENAYSQIAVQGT